jgi:hypothetical protein
MVRKSPAEVSAVFANRKEMLRAMEKETGKTFPFD